VAAREALGGGLREGGREASAEGEALAVREGLGVGVTGGVAESEMWNVFNMGVGYCFIVHPEFAEGVMKKLRKAGEQPFVMGKIAKGSGQVLWK
jgi:phosphoribosylformylglycinamidine cyclo-ligase